MNSLIQRSFAAGEVAPAVFGRSDQVKFQTGLKTCRNFSVRRHGGVSNRTGSGLVCEVKDSTIPHRLLKFVFNADQTYILLFGHLNMRVVRNGVLLTVSGLAAYAGGTTYALGEQVSSVGINYYSIQAGNVGNTPVSSPLFWYPMPGNIFEIPTPYATADLPTLYIDQSGDVITITHHLYPIYQLSRTGHTAWTLAAITMSPSIDAPTLANGGGAGTVTSWVATAVKADTFEESNISAVTQSSDVPTPGAPVTLTIGTVAGAQEYNVYKGLNGIYGSIGVSSGPTFSDTGIIPDMTRTAPIQQDPFVGAGNYPSTSGYFQQRHLFGDSDVHPEDVWGSRSAKFKNFTISSPLQDDDAVHFTVVGKQVNAVRHLVELDGLVILTSGGEWVAEGDATGALVPLSPNLKPKSYYGASPIPPVVLGNTLIYVQARGSFLRDFRQDLVEGTKSKDLTIFSPHLFEGYTMVHMDYAQIPHSIVAIVRSDGKRIGLTYLREQEIWGWHRHDTLGLYEDVCIVPEGGEDAEYVLVQRGAKRYLERFASRFITDVAVDAKFLDSFLTYDGRNTTATTMTLSGGTAWLYTETLTLTASAGFFVLGDVGNAIVLTKYTLDEDMESLTFLKTIATATVTLTITAYASPTVVSVRANKTVPAEFRALATILWAKAVDTVSGLNHLEGRVVGILADGNVITNGLDAPLTTVTAGAVTLNRPYSVIHVGLPYVSDFELLDLEVLGGETLSDKKKDITSVTLQVEDSRGIFAGPDAQHLMEYKQRSDEAMGEPVRPLTGKVEIKIPSKWSTSGKVFVRQRDPLPLTILSAVPNFELGG